MLSVNPMDSSGGVDWSCADVRLVANFGLILYELSIVWIRGLPLFIIIMHFLIKLIKYKFMVLRF